MAVLSNVLFGSKYTVAVRAETSKGPGPFSKPAIIFIGKSALFLLIVLISWLSTELYKYMN